MKNNFGPERWSISAHILQSRKFRACSWDPRWADTLDRALCVPNWQRCIWENERQTVREKGKILILHSVGLCSCHLLSTRIDVLLVVGELLQRRSTIATETCHRIDNDHKDIDFLFGIYGEFDRYLQIFAGFLQLQCMKMSIKIEFISLLNW